jgi:flagellar basal body-associated protein FliL
MVVMKKKNKKAQALSLNTIIIAALVLLVLVVLAIIFGTRARDFNTGQRSCDSKGGKCSLTACSEMEPIHATISTDGKSPDCKEKYMDYCCFDPNQ